MPRITMKILPTTCPACNEQLKVKSLICENCSTEIQGSYELPPLAQLSIDDQLFLLDFIKASGSLKDMAGLLKLSYPTIRNRLDEIIERIKLAENTGKSNKEKNL
jgi:hypothetical protein